MSAFMGLTRIVVFAAFFMISGGKAAGALGESEKCLLNRYQTILAYLLSDEESSIERESLLSEVINLLVIAYYYYQGQEESDDIRRTLIALMERHEKGRKLDDAMDIYVKDLAGDGERVGIQRRLRFLGFDSEILLKITEDLRKNRMSDFSKWVRTGNRD